MSEIQQPALVGRENGYVHAVEPHEPHMDLAGWLIAYEVSAAEAGLSASEAAERACRKLLERLAKLITPRGCQALLARAEHLARADCSADEADPAQVHRGLTTLLGTLIGLVALFIGEHLTARLVLEVWPDAPLLNASRAGARL